MASPTTLPARGYMPSAAWASSAPTNGDVILAAVLSASTGDDITVTGLGSAPASAVDATTNALTAVGATGKKDQVHVIPAPEGLAGRVIVAAGVGEAESIDNVDAEVMRRAMGVAARSVPANARVVSFLGDSQLRPIVEGFLLGSYTYQGLQTSPEHNRATSLTIVGGERTEFEAAEIVVSAVAFARDLVNTPCSHLYPESYARFLAVEAEKVGVTVEILDESQLEEQGYGGILAVGRGSSRRPRLVRLVWSPRSSESSVALVGKGITFDTGGISLKPGAGMDDMISDMGGSAAMAATVLAAARLKLPVTVSATLPLAENMPGGNAYRPGDVITHYGGATTEVLNTDAEGRLVLADALVRAREDAPDYLIDAATLTGAQLVALGLRTTGVMGDEELRERIASTGRTVGEQAWVMPIPEEIAEEFTSPSADLRNIGTNRFAGMMQAGYFLSQFAGDATWAHLDIAGPAYNTGRVHGYTPKKATGAPVRTLIAFLADVAERG